MSSRSSNLNEMSTRTYIYIYVHNAISLSNDVYTYSLWPSHDPVLACQHLVQRKLTKLVTQRHLLWLPEVAIWKLFEILGDLVMYSSYQVVATTWVKSYHCLGMHTSKEWSTRGTVSTATWPPMAPIMAPGELRCETFLRFREGWSRNNFLSSPLHIRKEGI